MATATGEHAQRLASRDRALALTAPSLAVRVWVALMRRRLDRHLADDPTPAWTDALRLRAAQLVSDEVRRDLACALDGMLALDEEKAQDRPRPEADVLNARRVLEALARRLRTGGPVSAQGMARVAMLVACHGDLNPDCPSSQLAACAVGALSAME